MNFLEPVRKAAQAFPGRPAVVDGDRTLSYTELWSAICRMAETYRERGLRPGDRVLVWFPNGAPFIVAHFGALAAGLVSIPVKGESGPVELDFALEDARPQLVAADLALLGKLTSGPPADVPIVSEADLPLEGPPADVAPTEVADDRVASINYSYFFGEGRPYGAELTHRNYAEAARGYARFHSIDSGDRTLVLLPMAHVFSLGAAILASLYSGAAVVVGRALRPRRVLETIVTERITQLPIVPQLLAALAEFHDPGKFDLSSLDHLVSGADFLPAPAHAAIEERLGVPIVQGYGLTECFPLVCNPPHGKVKLGTLGVTGFGAVRYRILDDEGRELPVGATGEIVIKSPTVMAGYLDAPEATARVLDDGWLRTGDLGWVDEDGYLGFEGLKKPILNVHGNNVDPVELRNVIGQLAGVRSVAIEAPNAAPPEAVPSVKIRAHVGLTHGAELEAKDVRAWCRKRLAAYKVPGEIVFDER